MYSHTNSEIAWLIYDFLLLLCTGYMFTVFFSSIFLCVIFMRPSSLGGGRILRRTLSVCLSVCPSVRLSVCPSVPLLLPSVTSRHLANYNDTLRAAYRTAISAAQILVSITNSFILCAHYGRLVPKALASRQPSTDILL